MESCPHGWSHTGRLPSRGPESLCSQAEDLAGECFFSSEVVVGRTRISTFQKDRFCFMCMTECHHVCICTTCVLTVTGGQTRALDLLELELDSGEPSCGCWEQTLGYPPEQQVTLTTESSPQPWQSLLTIIEPLTREMLKFSSSENQGFQHNKKLHSLYLIEPFQINGLK